MTVDVIIIIGGYISFFQVKQQLTTPLIPEDIIANVYYDSSAGIITACLISAGIFLVGLWFYSFKRKVIATILFSIVVLVFSAIISVV